MRASIVTSDTHGQFRPGSAAPVIDLDGKFNTLGGYGWFVHDALLAIATAYGEALVNSTEEHSDDPEMASLNGRWLPDVHCSNDMVIGQEMTKLAAQTACVNDVDCHFVEDRAPLGEGPFHLCRGFREMLVHCSTDGGRVDDGGADSQCSRVFDYSSNPHRFSYAPHRAALLESCLLVPPSDPAYQPTAAELNALSDACANSLVAGNRTSCSANCYYQAPTPEQVVTDGSAPASPDEASRTGPVSERCDRPDIF